MADEDGNRTIDITIEGMHCDRCVNTVKNALSGIDGIDYVDVSIGKARISYLPQLIFPEYIKKMIEGSGYSIPDHAKRKGAIGRFIDRMIASNEKTFGGERLDCCTLSKDDTSQKRTLNGQGAPKV